MALALTLKPQERLILGQAVIRNTGSQVIHLAVETPVPILRQRDILTEETAKTPCSRLYLVVQMLYLGPEQESLQQLYLTLAKDVLEAAPSLSPTLQEISLHVAAGDYYRALQAAKRLRQSEQELLERAKSLTQISENYENTSLVEL